MFTYSEYPPRKQITKPKRPESSNYFISTCMFLIRPFVKLSRDFCLWTSMHGFNHIAWARRHWFERILWALLTALAIWGAIDISLGQLQRYNDNPTVVALEKDFRNWRFNLPAVTICEKNRVDKAKLPKVIKSFWNITADHAKYNYYSDFVHTVANSDLLNLKGFVEFKDDSSLNVDMFKLAVDVVPELTVKTSWSGLNPPQPVEPDWTPVMTGAGACYSINSLAIPDIAIVPVGPNDTKIFPLTCKSSRQFCFVLFQIDSGSGYLNVYVHSNYDLVDISVQPYSLRFTYDVTVHFDVSLTGDGRGLVDLSPTRRGCRYTHEPMPGRKIFSANMCRLSCRINTAIKLCGCKPFYYIYAEGEVCGVAGLACLSSYAHRLVTNDGNQCSCTQPCIDATFRETSILRKIWDKGVGETHGALKLMVQAPRTRYTREILFNFQDLVVSFGGAAGLFLGASFISFVEVFYFFLDKGLGICVGNAIKEDIKESKKPPMPYEAVRVMELTRILEAQKRFEHGRHMKMYY